MATQVVLKYHLRHRHPLLHQTSCHQNNISARLQLRLLIHSARQRQCDLPPLDGAPLQGEHDLRAEAGVVRRLAEGESMKDIAQALEVSLETARTHAKRAMHKTDTHRQAELVSLVLHGGR